MNNYVVWLTEYPDEGVTFVKAQSIQAAIQYVRDTADNNPASDVLYTAERRPNPETHAHGSEVMDFGYCFVCGYGDGEIEM